LTGIQGDAQMIVQWYPGHMMKAMRMMQENIRLVDLVIELTDARVPQSSRNPDIGELSRGKSHIIVLNKCDLASENETKNWQAYYEKQGILSAAVNARAGNGVRAVQDTIREACSAKIERDRRRGILNRPVRAMVAGIPNVGKSTFINALAGKACTKTGSLPGVTRGKQWIHLNKNVELLDTPGILWPKFEDPVTGRNLAFIGSVGNNAIDDEELALELISYLCGSHQEIFNKRYGISQSGTQTQLLEDIGRSRGCIIQGGCIDTAKAARILLDDFRLGRLGRITLEEAPAQIES